MVKRLRSLEKIEIDNLDELKIGNVINKNEIIVSDDALNGERKVSTITNKQKNYYSVHGSSIVKVNSVAISQDIYNLYLNSLKKY